MLVDAMERAVLLHTLECVQPGLSPTGGVSQSDCFVFQDGRILTYNEGVCCHAKSGLPLDFKGAVKAKAFTDLLRKLVDETVGLSVEPGKLVILGSGRRAKLNMEENITIPIEGVEKPDKKAWQPVHEEFNDAIGIVQSVAESDTTQFVGTCIHIHPKWVEATDGYQVARYKLPTGVPESVLVKRDALKHVVPLDVTRVALTPKWIHFRNPVGVVLSCARHRDEYPDLKLNLQVEGVPASLPKGLADAVGVASIFSRENADSNLLIVSLKPGTKKNLMLTAIGTSGEYSEIKGTVYDGPPMAFTIPPEILTHVATKHSDCILSPKRLKTQGGKWVYVTSLGSPEAMEGVGKSLKEKVKASEEKEAPEEEGDE